jgi:hypothetical protein
MTIELIKLLANAKTTAELTALLDAFKRSYDRAYVEKDLVVGQHAQDSIQVIQEILTERAIADLNELQGTN